MRRNPRTTWLLAVMVTALAALLALGADRPQKPQVTAQGTRPLLKQLNEETQSLYREVQAGLVRVQLPAPRWAGAPLADGDNPLNKWGGQLDANVRARLEQEQKQAQQGQVRRLTPSVEKAQAAKAAHSQPATQPQDPKAGETVGAWKMSIGADDTIVFRPGAGGGALQFDAGGGIDPSGQIVGHGGRIDVSVAAGGTTFTPNNIGLLLDGAGHVLVPICIEKDQLAGQEIRVMVGPGEMTTATFVGSDRQTNITILKLTKGAGLPLKLAPNRPIEGALTMFLAPNTGAGRLMIWTNELRDWGVVVSMEGGVYGFTRQGQFLSAAGCKPVINQLIVSGTVQRATLGLGIVEVPQNGAIREATPALGTQPAVRITEVSADSPAARAGLKVGDLILVLNGQVVGDPSSFAAAMSDGAPRMPVQILRDGREQALAVEVGKDR